MAAPAASAPRCYPGPQALAATAVPEDFGSLPDLLRERKITPLIARRLELTQARQAHELLGQGDVVGKIVLVSEGPVPQVAPA